MGVTLLQMAVIGNNSCGCHTAGKSVSVLVKNTSGCHCWQLSAIGNNASRCHTVATASGGE